MTTARDEIEAIVKDLNEKYPKARFSFGYLFNHPCPQDRQQWYMFTQVCCGNPYDPVPQRFRYAFNGKGYFDAILDETKSPSFEQWVEKVVSRIDSPENQSWLDRIAREA